MTQEVPTTGRRTLKRKAAEESKAMESKLRKLAPKVKETQRSRHRIDRQEKRDKDETSPRVEEAPEPRRKPRILPKLRQRLERKNVVSEDTETYSEQDQNEEVSLEETKPKRSEVSKLGETSASTERLRTRYNSVIDNSIDEGSSVEEAPKKKTRVKKRGKKKRGELKNFVSK